MSDRPLQDLSDDELLAQVARLWEQVDPAPDDLADGALARMAAQDLEYELLVLVENDSLAGVRSVSTLRDRDEVGTWSMEYVGPSFRVYVRITHDEDNARVDGWVVPARPLTVRLSSEPPFPVIQQTQVSDLGRFEFSDAPNGACRMTFLTEPRTSARPHVTPPFWI